MTEKRQVAITGGTFALCFWLFVIADQGCSINRNLDRIADALSRAYPVSMVTPKPNQ